MIETAQHRVETRPADVVEEDVDASGHSSASLAGDVAVRGSDAPVEAELVDHQGALSSVPAMPMTRQPRLLRSAGDDRWPPRPPIRTPAPPSFG